MIVKIPKVRSVLEYSIGFSPLLPVPSDSPHLAMGLLEKCLRTETPRSHFSLPFHFRSCIFPLDVYRKYVSML